MGGGGGMEPGAAAAAAAASLRSGGVNGHHLQHPKERCGQDQGNWDSHFQMPLHYPRYTRADYETMPEWKLDCLLREYGLPVSRDVEYKRRFAVGSFLWMN